MVVLGVLAIGLVMKLALVAVLLGDDNLNIEFAFKGSEFLGLFGGEEVGYI